MSNTDTREALLSRVGEAVRAIEPSAEIILYGSRARGDYDEESDWDFLIIVEGEVATARQEAIWRRLYELRRELDALVSAIVVSADQWQNAPYRTMPLFKEVRREGIPV